MSVKTILVVEDEKSLRTALHNKFTKEGYQVLLAADGSEGLQSAKADKPDLILLDIVMPLMDGITMLRELRDDSWGKDVPVILLTNLNDEQRLADAMTRGVHDYLVKSDWKIQDVVDVVNKRLAASD